MADDKRAKAQDAVLKTPPGAGEEIAALLEDREMPVSELLERVSALKVGAAWAAGLLSFGHRTRVVNGQPGKPDCQLIVESGWNWTGEKKAGQHVGFREMVEKYARPLPECKHYREYPESVPADHDPARSPLRDVTRAQAEKLLALWVRLTDKGLAILQAD